MAAEYNRVVKRARDLRQAELEAELAAIKHDPQVRVRERACRADAAGWHALLQCSCGPLSAPVGRMVPAAIVYHPHACHGAVLSVVRLVQGATRRLQLQIELRGLRLIEVQAAMRAKVEAKQVWCCFQTDKRSLPTFRAQVVDTRHVLYTRQAAVSTCSVPCMSIAVQPMPCHCPLMPAALRLRLVVCLSFPLAEGYPAPERPQEQMSYHMSIILKALVTFHCFRRRSCD